MPSNNEEALYDLCPREDVLDLCPPDECLDLCPSAVPLAVGCRGDGGRSEVVSIYTGVKVSVDNERLDDRDDFRRLGAPSCSMDKDRCLDDLKLPLNPLKRRQLSLNNCTINS